MSLVVHELHAWEWMVGPKTAIGLVLPRICPRLCQVPAAQPEPQDVDSKTSWVWPPKAV